MFCERCHKREAIVHVTRVDAPSGKMTKHDFCEECFRETDSGTGDATAGWTSYDPTRPTKPKE